MENLVAHNLFNGVYKNRKVLVTGHTGFKGSWLCHWLTQMGADVCGYSLPSPSTPSHFQLINNDYNSIIGDIRDEKKLQEAFLNHKPEIVFHLAAQPLVRYSYKEPIETYETNVIGTLKVYEACRKSSSVRSIISITTDKVYQNNEWCWGYRETDRLGGKDPYSSSKAAMEILSSSYISSYFNPDDFENHNVLLATTRAGNVIGGGDWAEDRLIPDIMKAAAKEETVEIRSPNSTRPWQHVLDPLSGYLLLGQNLIERKREFAKPFNFGPPVDEDVSVEELIKLSQSAWSKVRYKVNAPKEVMREAKLLKLDCSLAADELKWKRVFNLEETIRTTVSWYKNYYESSKLNTDKDLEEYITKAKNLNLTWTSDNL